MAGTAPATAATTDCGLKAFKAVAGTPNAVEKERYNASVGKRRKKRKTNQNLKQTSIERHQFDGDKSIERHATRQNQCDAKPVQSVLDPTVQKQTSNWFLQEHPLHC